MTDLGATSPFTMASAKVGNPPPESIRVAPGDDRNGGNCGRIFPPAMNARCGSLGERRRRLCDRLGRVSKRRLSGAALDLVLRQSRLVEAPGRYSELLRLVGEIGGDAGAGEDHDADRQRLKQAVVALKGGRIAVAVPVGLEDDLWNFAIVGPAGGDALGAARAGAVQQHHVGVLGPDLVERLPDAGVIVAVGAAGKGNAGAGRGEHLRVGPAAG